MYEKSRIESQTREMFIKALGEGPYSVIAVGYADAVMTSEVQIDAFLHYYSVEKTAIADKDGKTVYKVYLNEQSRAVLTYTLRDSRTGRVLDTYTFRGLLPVDGCETSFVCETTTPDEYKSSWYFGGFTVTTGYEDFMYTIRETVKSRLVPHAKTTYLSLMANKPEVPELNFAYEAVENGLYKEALAIFSADWESNRNVQSGYNSAILMYALGDTENAVTRAYQVVIYSSDSKAVKLYSKLKSLKADDSLARTQIGIN